MIASRYTYPPATEAGEVHHIGPPAERVPHLMNAALGLYFRYSEYLLPSPPHRSIADIHMPQTLVVSSRGQITLPASTRKRFGIKGGDVVILEDRGNEIALKPGMVLEVQQYSDDQIAQWDADDRLEDQERARILDAVTGLR